MDVEYPKNQYVSLDPHSKHALLEMQTSLRELISILSRIEEKLDALNSG